MDKEIKLTTLSDINKLIDNAYICDSTFNDYSKDRLERCKVIFSDRNYKVVTDYNKTRILFDKKYKLIFAVVSISPDFKARDFAPYALYVLDDKMMPIYSISMLGGKEFHIYKYTYKDKQVHIEKAKKINEMNINLNLNNLRYSELLTLIDNIKNKFEYEYINKSLDQYFYDVPYWTEGIR
ncbi:hypothetical protein ABS768_05750 [Flavobacterium sp. ST-75]|uniref:Uncharacterized protein n=1 Tax=Flavobacterium rhizophilum TaxID=3163296 RepID=A0ABW8YA16_9FLAO